MLNVKAHANGIGQWPLPRVLRSAMQWNRMHRICSVAIHRAKYIRVEAMKCRMAFSIPFPRSELVSLLFWVR